MANIPDYRAKRVNLNYGAEKVSDTSQQSSKYDKDPFYKTNRWRKKSEAHRAENPYCAQCMKEGRVVLGAMCDHVIPMSKGGDNMDDRNLQTMCNTCHNKKRQEESRGIILPWRVNEDGFKIPKIN